MKKLLLSLLLMMGFSSLMSQSGTIYFQETFDDPNMPNNLFGKGYNNNYWHIDSTIIRANYIYNNLNVIYVTVGGAGTKDGTSWADAMDDLNIALNIASIYSIPNIWVAAGTYYGDSIAEHNAFTMVDGVNVYGGFAGNESEDYDLFQRNFDANETILDGQNVQRVLYQPTDFLEATIWDGFVIKNGYAYDETTWCYGAGAYIRGNSIITNCIIMNNNLYGMHGTGGGGLFAYGTSTHRAYVNNCKIYNNTSLGEGGWMNMGGGVYIIYTDIYNCLINNNYSVYGGGLYCYNNSSNIINCDIVKNHGIGVYCNGTNHFKNSIIWGNQSQNIYFSGPSLPNQFIHCAIEGGYQGYGNINLASDNDGFIDSLHYVRFIDIDNNNFELQYNSACVDAGDPDNIPSNIDLAGNSRIFNGRIDIGCYEYNGIAYIETSISDEICHGENYLQNGFEIIQPEVGEGKYSITLPSSLGLDSIVNLTLMVHPNYYIEIDTILCDQTSFLWNGNTYTESGIYYDSLQTVHGCDSIMKLSLEFFNTPLGEFASMIPTNNYPFTSLPITFRWDAVPEVEYYDLFVWNANEQMPAEPIKTKLYNRSFVVNSLPNHQSYKWCVVANNHCHINMSDVRSFTLDIPPAMNVNTNAMSFGETNLNSDKTMSLYISATALNDSISIQLTGEDADMFSFVKDNAWNNWNGGMIYVTFNPTVVKYNFNAMLEITSGDITETVSLSGSIADVFVFNTYVTQDVFQMNSTIPIYGSVTYNNNIPIAAADVEVKVNVMGTTRSLFATTDDNGQFEVDFIPANSESGYYTINSGRVSHNSTAIHDEFSIPGMSLVTTDYILWYVTKGESTTGSIVIKNKSMLPLTNISVAAVSQPEGCSFTFLPLSIGGMDEGLLEYSITGSTLTNGNNYEEVKLVVTSSEGAVLNFSTWYYCVEPRGVLYVEPNHITTTMTRGNNKIVDVMLYNNGTGPTGDVTVEIPSEDWLSVVGNHVLPSIAVHDSAYFSLRLAADNTTPLVQYTGNIAINCENSYGVPLSYNITAVSDSTGVLVVDVTDDYTYNGNGQHLAGATVTVKGYYSLETVAAGLTGSDGKFVVNDIPEGYYRLSISAPQHEQYHANIQIDGGQTNTQNIYLQYQAITYSWNVVPTEIEDEYTFELVVQYETNVPVPVVTIEMPYTFPELEEGESFVFNYVITNHGLVDACETTLYPPTSHPLYDFTPLITDIDTLHAQTTVLVPCTMTRRITERSPKVYTALHQNGNRDEYSCPYYAQTKTKQYYMCGNEKIWFWATVGRNIGETTCETVPYSYTPGAPSAGGGGGGAGAGAGGGSYSPQIVVVHNSGCDSDDCLDNIKNTIDNCNSNGGSVTSPNLPPKKPANNN